VADVCPRALGRDRRRGFLHDRSLDLAGVDDFYTVFVIDLAFRRVHIVGSTSHPDEPFMQQVGRTLTAGDDGALIDHRVLICDRDRKWTLSVRQLLAASGDPNGADSCAGAQCEGLRFILHLIGLIEDKVAGSAV
jgi:hypothetical protein